MHWWLLLQVIVASLRAGQSLAVQQPPEATQVPSLQLSVPVPVQV
jgi:hypothetical protein